MTSSPAPPSMTLLPALPVRVSLKALPVMFSKLDRVSSPAPPVLFATGTRSMRTVTPAAALA